jgi:hypothetical protein
MNPTSRARTRLVTVVSLLALGTAIAAPSALAEEPAPSPEPIVAPDPNPDPAPRTAPRSKPVVKTPPARPVVVTRSEPARTRSEPARTAPAASKPTPRRAAVDVTAPRGVRHQPPPGRVAKRRTAPETSEPTPARPRRELPFASFVPARTLAASATAAPSSDPDPIDLTWPALFVLGAALAAAAAAAASAAAPSFRLALVGGLSDRPSLSRPGHIERRVRRPRHPSPVIPELPPPEPPPALAPGTYEIEWFRGYVKSRFFVLLEGPDGDDRLVESPWFSWRQAEPPPPPMPDFVAARDALLAKLEREGWHECGRGQAWFSQRVTAGDRL